MSSDVLSDESDIDVYIYDRSNQEAFLGHVRVSPNVNEDMSTLEGWYKLGARDPGEERVSGEIHLEMHFQKTDKKHFGPEDFQIIKLIGKGSSLISRSKLLKMLNDWCRHLWSGLSGTKERYSALVRDEGLVEEGHCAKERSSPYIG